MSFEICNTGPFGLALQRLMSTHPLFAVTIDGWDIVADADAAQGTMAVTLSEGIRIRLAYSPAFLAEISPDQAASVLQHELQHVLQGHLSMSHDDFPEEGALRVAQEITANEWVSGPLPGEPILLSDYPGFPPAESTADRYRRLVADTPSAKPPGGLGTRCCSTPGPTPSATVIEQVLIADVAEAVSKMDPTQASRSLRALGRELPAHGPGASLRQRLIQLGGGGPANTDWRQILRRVVSALRERRPTLTRPARRFPELLGIVPGRMRSPGKPVIMAVLDTSGSMCGPETLASIRSEVQALGTLADILVVECDDHVRRTYRFTGALLEIAGGGGTSFIEPLRTEFLKSNRVDAVFYFTDGFGTAPSSAPHVRLVWCLLGEWARPPATWGHVLRIPS